MHDAVAAPSNLKLSGTFRARYETIDSAARAGVPRNEDYITLRTTLFAEYAAGPLRIGGELWDSRIYDADLPSSAGANEVNTFEPVQAYAAVDLKDPLGLPGKATLQAGRFLLNIGSRRLVAADDYRNTTNGYTGLRGDFLGRDFSLTAYAVTPQIRLPDSQADVLDNRARLDKETNDTLLWGALVDRNVSKATTLEFGYVGFKEQDAVGRPTRDRDLATFTGRVLRNPAPERFDIDAEVGYQTGSVSSSALPGATTLDAEAGFFHLRAGYSFADAWKSHVSFDYDWVEGDDSGPKYRRFDTLFGMRRADFSPGGLYSLVGRANISSPGARWEATFDRRWDGMLSYHPMWLASSTDSFSNSNVRDATGRSGDFAGHQWDGRVRYWLVPGSVRLEGVYILVNKGRFLREAPNAPSGDRNTNYLALIVTSTF
ncbi:MAG: hypothetical protein BGN86_00570 [Caulobacterales bacterium 68-7]|nr:MAG: hypothetical protein BGN86_00570 [Caulobacterales bacterium 68-7]